MVPSRGFNFQSGTCSVSEMFPRLPQGSNPGPPLPEASALTCTTRLLLLTQDMSECTPGNKYAMFKCVQALNPLIFPATTRVCVCGVRGYSHIGTVLVCHGKASHFWPWQLLKTPLFRPVQLKTIILFIKICFLGLFLAPKAPFFTCGPVLKDPHFQ